MAVTYGFFNSVNGDRKYNADTMSEFYTGICSQGVFQSVDNGLAVSAGTGLTVNVATGRAIIQGHWVKNDAALTLSIDAASATYARIDAVVIRYSASNRNIQIVVKTGTPAASPSAPSMTRAGGVYELCLAYVNVAANATSVTVTDKRSNTSVCGWAAVAQAIDGTYEALIDDIKTGFDGVVYQNPGDAVRGEDEKLSNKIDIQNGGSYTFVDGKYINSNGGESSGSGLSYLDYYPVVPNGYVHIETYMAYGMSIAFFDENKTFITGSAIQNSSGSIGVKFTVDVNCSASAHYVRVSVNGTNKKDLLVINKLAISIPYKVSQLQNDRQFLTEESVDDLTEKVDSLFDISPNLWSPSDTTIGKLSTDNGSVNTSLTDYVTSDFIPFRSGESVYVYYKTISTGEVHLVTPEMGNASADAV